MDFQLTDEQKMIQSMVRDFAEKEVKPIAEEIDREERVPSENIKKMGELGLLGMTVPREYGGSGADYVSYAIACEELARVCASTAALLSGANSLNCWPILAFGTEEQKQKYLVPMASGKTFGCFALTEAGAGSDVGSVRMKAELKGEEYVLNGTKLFITSGSIADTIIVFARTGDEPGVKGLSAFIVEKETEGFSIGKIEEKLGIRGTPTAELIFEDCHIPKENLLGEEGQGFKISMATLDGGRIGIGACALGLAQGCLDESLLYSKEREQFGQPISNFQAIQWKLADMATQIEAARLMVYRAAQLKDRGEKCTVESSMAKMYASEIATKAAIDAVQIHGGYGYTKDFAVERFMRDVKIFEIFEGTSEMQRLVIARGLLK
ncbi:MAG: acyl-CoA dehydrogenase [Methanobacteriota archaeon]|nr:MAG: acyl-CoA dehydrogenase [Euryarchaeota archaeon]